jgi:ABC-type branched-subunit amino acid transport system substrate-binding protein
MKRVVTGCILVLFCLAGRAQAVHHQKIAIFTPLYLDSAFDAAGNVRFDKSFPRYLTPGLEFYIGARMALDSLQKRGAPLEVFIYDTRGRNLLSQQLANPELNDVEMIIAHSNAAETKTLADVAMRKKIPFISATFPNDAGVLNNPYYVVLNSTLQTHVEGAYRLLQRYYSNYRIIVFRKPGTQEDQIKTYLSEFAKSTVATPLNLKFVDIGMDFTPRTIAAQLDSTQKTICIAGSLDEGFAGRLTQTLAALNRTYPVTVIGMPTWDNFNFSKVGDLEIIYSSPFFYNRTNSLENALANEFNNRINNKPTDMFFRGYETTLRFALLLLDTKKDVASSLTRKGNTVITQFDIQPVFKDRSDMNLDYFENKHLYFIKLLGGVKNTMN